MYPYTCPNLENILQQDDFQTNVNRALTLPLQIICFLSNRAQTIAYYGFAMYPNTFIDCNK